MTVVQRWRDQEMESFCFVASDQWSEADRAALKGQNRAPSTFNRVGPVVDVVCGLETNARQEITVKGREGEDGKAAEAGSELLRWIFDQCDAEDEEAEAFCDMVIGGLGVIEDRWDTDLGRSIKERLDPFECGWDHKAKKRNLEDRKYAWRCRDVDIEDAKAEFPGFEKPDLDASWVRSPGTGTKKAEGKSDKWDHGRTGPTFTSDDTDDDTVTICYFQWWEWERYAEYVDEETGERTEMPLEDAYKLAETINTFARDFGGDEAKEFEVRPKRKKVWYHAWLGSVVLYEGQMDVQDGSGGIKFLTGKMDKKEGIPYGIVRALKDPQRFSNKLYSQMMHIMNSNAKGGWIGEESAWVDKNEFEDNAASPAPTLEVADGALSGGQIREIAPAAFPTAIQYLLEFATQSTNQVSGIPIEILGLQERNIPGVVEVERKQQAVTILAVFFDNLRRYRKDSARSHLAMSIMYLEPAIIARAIGQHLSQYITAMTADGWMQYDIVVDESPESTNAKQRNWGYVQPLIGMLGPMGIPQNIWPHILRASPLSSSFSEDIIRELEKQPAPDPKQVERDEQTYALVTADRVADILLKRAKARESAANVDEDSLDRAKVAADIMKIMREMGVSEGRLALDASKEARTTVEAMRTPDPYMNAMEQQSRMSTNGKA